MLDNTFEKAQELGRLIGQTEEYRALQRAQQRIADDRDANQMLARLREIETEANQVVQRGETPPEALQQEYEAALSTLQASPAYQQVVAGQSNFDKLLARVNEEIAKGMEAGAQSRIILPS